MLIRVSKKSDEKFHRLSEKNYAIPCLMCHII